MSNEEQITKYEAEISDIENQLEDETLSSLDKEVLRSKIRSLNLNITALKMQDGE